MAAKNSLGNQFIDVFHRSYSSVPPHEVSGEEYLNPSGNKSKSMDLEHLKTTNPKGDLIFTGTRKAADEMYDADRRPYLHKYQIPAAMVRPETFADDISVENVEPARQWGDTTPGELWETTPVQTDLVTPGSAVKYRNVLEDFANISHVIHKGSVASGKVKYLGMEETPSPNKRITRSESFFF